MSTQTTVKHNGPVVNGHMMPSRVESTETSKPLLQSILQSETASPFMKKPSNVYQIEYTSNIYNPEAINSMAMSSSHATTFTPTISTNRPVSFETTIKNNAVSSSSTLSSLAFEREEKNHFVPPEIQAGWPIYNLIIEGHSKVKTYGLKNNDAIENNLPKIRSIQGKKNPIVERITKDEGPEFIPKPFRGNEKVNDKILNSSGADKNAAITKLLNFLDTSFGNFLSDENVGKVRADEIKNISMGSENPVTEREKPKAR